MQFFLLGLLLLFILYLGKFTFTIEKYFIFVLILKIHSVNWLKSFPKVVN